VSYPEDDSQQGSETTGDATTLLVRHGPFPLLACWRGRARWSISWRILCSNWRAPPPSARRSCCWPASHRSPGLHWSRGMVNSAHSAVP